MLEVPPHITYTVNFQTQVCVQNLIFYFLQNKTETIAYNINHPCTAESAFVVVLYLNTVFTFHSKRWVI